MRNEETKSLRFQRIEHYITLGIQNNTYRLLYDRDRPLGHIGTRVGILAREL